MEFRVSIGFKLRDCVLFNGGGMCHNEVNVAIAGLHMAIKACISYKLLRNGCNFSFLQGQMARLLDLHTGFLSTCSNDVAIRSFSSSHNPARCLQDALYSGGQSIVEEEVNPHFPDSYLGMEEQHVIIDKEVFQEYKCNPTISDVKFIKGMTSILKGGAITWWEAAGVLKKFAINLQSFHICEILKKNIDCDAAVGLFRWAEAQPGYKHDSKAYNILLKTLGCNHNFKQMQSLLNEMDAKQIRKTYVTFMVLVQSYFDGGMVDRALQVFFEFEKYVRPKPKKKYYLYVLKRLFELQRSESIPIIVKGMLEVGHVADTETFNSVIQGLCNSGHASDAIDLSREMVKKGCSPDVNTYIYLISGLVRSQSLERASDIIADMASSGCKPNIHNFNLLLEFLFSIEKPVEALSVVKQMLAAGCELDIGSNRILMDFFEASGDAVLALDFYQDLKEHDIYPDLVTYNSLLRMLNAAGLQEQALKLYEEIKRDGSSPPDLDTNNIILHVLCKAGKMDEALQVFQDMEARLKPNKITYDILLTGLAVHKKLTDCLKLLKQMDSLGFSPERETYVSLISAFSKGGLHDKAFKLFGRMKLEGLSPDLEMYNAILKKRRKDMEAERKKMLQDTANSSAR